jgi:hypothetical protein
MTGKFPPPGSTAGWNGRAVANARTWYATTLEWPTPCARCSTLLAQPRWVLGHKLDRQAHPQLTWHTDNWQAECRSCSDSSGATQGNRRRGIAIARTKSAMTNANGRFLTQGASFLTQGASAPALPRSLSSHSPRTGGEWLPDVPVPPSIESPSAGDAVGSYGGDFVSWCEASLGESPRPWQAYVAARLLEHDSAGQLVYRRVGISVPRQVGKSVLLRMLAAWRMHQADRFREPQTVLHVAHALNTTEEVFLPALQWAKGRGLEVREANGQMRIAVGGSRWLPRSTQTGYGFTLSLALVDEAWAVAERRVNSGYAPTLSERRSGQVVMFSSANQEATPLFPRFREAAMQRPGWLLLEWSAPPGVVAGDAGVWQSATPVPIDVVRAELMADELVASEATFRFERLNSWPVLAGLSWGEMLAARLPAPSQPVWSGVLVGGLESEPDGSGWGAAVSDGGHVECVQVLRLGEALSWLAARGVDRLLMHESVAKQLEGRAESNVVKVSATDTRAATAVLRDGVAGLSWSGVLGEQLRNVRVSSTGGVEQIDGLRSSGPVAAVKAAAWCLWSARTAPAELAAIFV